MLAAAFAALGLFNPHPLTRFYLFRQDLPVLFAAIGLWMFLARDSGTRAKTISLPRSKNAIVTIALALAVIGVAGHHLLLAGHIISRDEQMALFDANIFTSGHIEATLGQEWRGFVSALNDGFLATDAQAGAWRSDYRPINALLLAGGVLTGMPWLVGPLLVALGCWASWACARRIWPDRDDAAWVTTITYALSAQVWMTGMTAYAMNAHLALNMVWLLLVLKGRPWSYAIALAVTFLATGLHQVNVHPLFIGPFLLLMLWRRQWLAFAMFAAVQLLAVGFWLKYPAMFIGAPVPETGGAIAGAGASFLDRIAGPLAGISPDYLWTKAANLARFFAWQHLLLLPLLLAGGVAAVKRHDPLLLALLGAFLAILFFKLLMRPYQGHGFGYRYMHGTIGVASLLAAAGWIELRERGVELVRPFAIASVATLLFPTPWLAYHGHRFAAAYAEADRAIGAIDADVAIVPSQSVPFGDDLVINRPDLSNRPIRLQARKIGEPELARLCARNSVAFVDVENLLPVADMFDTTPEPYNEDRVRSLAPASCRVVSD